MSVTSALPSKQAIARILDLTGRPKATNAKPWIVLPVGLPGSGKSTFCRKLAKTTGAVIIESDVLRSALFGIPTHDKEESKQLFEALYGAASVLLKDGAIVIVDATNLREGDRRRAYDAAEAASAEVLILHFQAPERVIAERMSGRDHHADPDDHSTAGMSVYARMARTEEPISREHWDIDTSNADETEAALQRAIETLKRDTANGQDTGGRIS